MKKLFLFSILSAVLLLAANNSLAQAKKLLVFKRGVATATGTIKGTESKTFYFKVKKDTDMEIEVQEAEPRAKFMLYKPDGKNFYDEQSPNEGDIFDMIDLMPQTGTYKVVVQLPAELQTTEKPVKFTLRLLLRSQLR